MPTTVPVHRGHRQATRVLSGVILRAKPKPPEQQPEDTFVIEGVVNEPFKYAFGHNLLQRIRDRPLGSCRAVNRVHRTSRNDMVPTNPIREPILVHQVDPPVRLQHLVRARHLGVELVLPGVVPQVHPVATGDRHPARQDFIAIVLLKSSGDRGWGTMVKWYSGLSLCVCVRMCFVGCLSKAPLFPSRALLKWSKSEHSSQARSPSSSPAHTPGDTQKQNAHPIKASRINAKSTQIKASEAQNRKNEIANISLKIARVQMSNAPAATRRRGIRMGSQWEV